ncbi:YitT family protein [Shouchella shacheensis]|uniref:YitT family protein n=1 Tax=Shouchella shacheensis TaxID=1649580 RepID=UPI00073FBD2E|nr:YitT family protein [Shouchella shacheensis]
MTREFGKIFIVVLGSLLLASSLNLFLIPADVFASGFTGVAQLISLVLPFSVGPGVLLFLLNIPVAILGWVKVGKSFTIYSFLSVVLVSLFLEFLPVRELSSDIMLNSVFGGVLGAAGAGLLLKWGASSGGLDIIALVLARSSDRPVGIYFFILNSIIVIAAGLLLDPEKALFTLISIYVTSRVIDAIHTRYVKLTAMVVTKQPDVLTAAIHKRLTRGITRLPAKGGYTFEEKEMLVIVITRYELYELKNIIDEVDPEAFTNIVETASIFGLFRKD